MTTGAVLGALAPSEAYQAIVAKALALGVAVPPFAAPSDIIVALNAVLASASLPSVKDSPDPVVFVQDMNSV